MYHYKPLQDHLTSAAVPVVSLTYAEIERLIGRKLPPSARGEYRRQFWANTLSHSQAKAWLGVGRRAKFEGGERVSFHRMGAQAPEFFAPPEKELKIPLSALVPSARRLIEDVREETGVSLSDAVANLLNQAALRRRQEALDWFAENTLFSKESSADLIREDRDAR